MKTLLLIIQRNLIRNNGFSDLVLRKDVMYAVSRYMGNIPRGFRKRVYEEAVRDMIRLKLLKPVDRYKFQIINKEQSKCVEEEEVKWF